MRCIGKAVKTIHRNNDSYFTIASFDLVKEIDGEVEIHPIYKTFTVVGIMPYLMEDADYEISATEVENKKYGKQYQVNSINLYLPNGIESKEGQKEFLDIIFTKLQVKEMYEALDDPYMTLKDGDISSLVKVKNCGMKTAVAWIDKFKTYMPLSNAMKELSEYDLTEALLRRIVNHYKSSDIAVEIIQNKPYKLIEVNGVGWHKCDEIAMKGGLKPDSPERIGTYILYYLQERANEGYSYIPADANTEIENGIVSKTQKPINFIDTMIEFFGDDISDEALKGGLDYVNDQLWFSDNRRFVGLKRIYDLEMSVAENLIRIRDGENDFKYSNWKDIIKQKEIDQGWEYNEQQIKGIKAVLENQVVVITGKAGTGKSSIVDAMIAVLQGYSYAQTALSGRAAARMAEITHEEGYTIHRLLGFPKGDRDHGGFVFHEDNKLPRDIIILDEVSMVDGELFNRLVKAIKTGSKLIMLGDTGQLECIGCMNIAADLIASKEIVSIELSQIHRQAANSGIITESIKAREGIQLIEKDWIGTEVRGKLNDLVLDCFSDKSNTFYKVMQHASSELEDGTDIMDLMVIAPSYKNESGVDNLNAALQSLYNPDSPEKKEVFVQKSSKAWMLREGDKIINVQNDYYAKNKFTVGIFNGNIGVVKNIDIDANTIAVDFQDIPGIMILPKKNWKDLELGYAITCHKAQGSQCKKVIVGLDFGSFIQLSREWVYTAMTRAIDKCYMVAQNNALRYAVSKNSISVKRTHLVKLLAYKAANKFSF
ncbi:AAA family ATPase [Anaerostipes hadrus]|jgi:exodeoxyribonuclease V alpha subunit|uniref:AAA family ATPase n=1 Tax=Anaerostipes hadrus TaxID=649756 RepID=UPI0018985C75|nr:AAA family ATPase [Anaerostipes hadrus]